MFNKIKKFIVKKIFMKKMNDSYKYMKENEMKLSNGNVIYFLPTPGHSFIEVFKYDKPMEEKGNVIGYIGYFGDNKNTVVNNMIG